MTSTDDLRRLQARLREFRRENDRLRRALSEREARAAGSGHEFVIADAIGANDQSCRCLVPAVPGRITVIVPAFNASAFIERAVRSVWGQSLDASRIELLVVDDGSADSTGFIVERLAAESPVSMRLLRHPNGVNRGVAPTRQLGIVHATGELVALLDADDAYLPDRLARTAEALRSDQPAVTVCAHGRNVDADGRSVVGHNATTRAGDWRTLACDLHPPFTFDQLWRADPIANSTLTIRRTALERVGGFPSLMAHQAEDWLLVLKLSLLAPIPCLDEDLILYTHHPAAYTHRYHADGLGDGARLEVLYHLVWWMLRSPEHADAGARLFRREYPKLVAHVHRLLPLVERLEASGLAPEDLRSLELNVASLTREVEALRRVLRVKLHENKRLRRVLTARAGVGSTP